MYYILFNLCSVFQFHWWPFLLRLAQRLLYFFYESIKSCLIRIRFFWYFLVCFISKLLRMKTITHDDPSSTFQTDYHSKEQLLFYVWIEILFCFDYLKIPTNSFLWVWNNRENMFYLIVFFPHSILFLENHFLCILLRVLCSCSSSRWAGISCIGRSVLVCCFNLSLFYPFL